jgi:hypothetical protein
MLRPGLPVDLSAVTDLYDLNDSSLVIDRVNDTVGTLANPIAFLGARELLAAGRPRDSRKTFDSRNDPRANCPRLDGLKLLGADVLMRRL